MLLKAKQPNVTNVIFNLLAGVGIVCAARAPGRGGRASKWRGAVLGRRCMRVRRLTTRAAPVAAVDCVWSTRRPGRRHRRATALRRHCLCEEGGLRKILYSVHLFTRSVLILQSR